MNLFRPNLNTKGRVIRGVCALCLAVGATVLWTRSRTMSVALAVSAVFVGFEAARGWCALRACGVKTKF